MCFSVFGEIELSKPFFEKFLKNKKYNGKKNN